MSLYCLQQPEAVLTSNNTKTQNQLTLKRGLRHVRLTGTGIDCLATVVSKWIHLLQDLSLGVTMSLVELMFIRAIDTLRCHGDCLLFLRSELNRFHTIADDVEFGLTVVLSTCFREV